jgi:hypothetical protein
MQLKLGDGNVVEFAAGNFLKPDAVKDGDNVVILDAGSAREAQYGEDEPKNVVDFKVSLNKKEYVWTMNTRTIRNIAAVYGDDATNWVGKVIKIEKVKMDVFGKLKDVLIGSPTETNEEAEAKAEKKPKAVLKM